MLQDMRVHMHVHMRVHGREVAVLPAVMRVPGLPKQLQPPMQQRHPPPLVEPFPATPIPNISHFPCRSPRRVGSRLRPSSPRDTDPAPTSLCPPTHPSTNHFTNG